MNNILHCDISYKIRSINEMGILYYLNGNIPLTKKEDGSIMARDPYGSDHYLDIIECDALIDFYKKEINSLRKHLRLLKKYNHTNESIRVINSRIHEAHVKKEAADRDSRWDEDISFKRKNEHLYLFINTQTKHLKIGRSKNVKARLSSINVSSPFDVEFIFEIKSKGYMEKEIHKMFSKYNKKGEWFEYNEDIISFFEGLKEGEESLNVNN